MMKKLLGSIFALLLISTSAYAQVTVTGVITDSYGLLVGCSVILQGTSRGVTTEADGTFSIQVPDPQRAVLNFQFVGMDDVEVALNGRTSGIEVNMLESANQLDAVVAIGYGTARRGELTGSVSSVSAKTIAATPVANAAEAIKGRLPGVQITSVDGSPDAEIQILVRGGVYYPG